MSRKFISVNAYTQQVLKEYKFNSSKEINDAISRSNLAFKEFSQLSFTQRGQKISNLGNLLVKHNKELSTLMSIEMGKPISYNMHEVSKSASCCNYYAMNAENLLKPQKYPISNDCEVHYQPLGSIFLIMPFNFPLWMPMKNSIPHLMAGNTIVLKHAENIPQTADLIEKIAKDAGLVDEFINIRPDFEEIEKIIENPHIKGVILTDSVNQGKRIAEVAARNIKKYAMELGGNNPFIVLSDADLPKAAKALVARRLAGYVQIGVSTKRAIVCNDVYDEFVKLVHEEIQNWTVGDPLNENTKIGPLAHKDLLEIVSAQVSNSVQMGAKLMCGGKPKENLVYPPTLLVDVTENMKVFNEEVFGPVVSITKANNEGDAIRLANLTEYGLCSSIFTKNQERARKEIAPKILSGIIVLNETSRSTVQVPFGGIKNSEIVRGLASEEIKEFCNVKTIYLG